MCWWPTRITGIHPPRRWPARGFRPRAFAQHLRHRDHTQRRRDGGHTIEGLASPKFFRRGRFTFQGHHEQLVPVEGGPCRPPPASVPHSGYEDRDALLARIDRNRRILLRELERHPDDEYYLYQMGKADFCRKEYNGAVRAFEKSLASMTFSGAALPTGTNGRPVSEDMLIDLLTCLAYACANLERYREACDLLERHRAMGHPATRWADFPHALGYLYLMLGDVPRAREAFLSAVQTGSRRELVRGTGGFSAFYHLGLLAEAEGNIGAALGNYLQSLQARPDYTTAISRCVDLVTERRAALPPGSGKPTSRPWTVYVKRLVKH